MSITFSTEDLARGLELFLKEQGIERAIDHNSLIFFHREKQGDTVSVDVDHVTLVS